MNYPLRTITFIADLVHPPAQHKTEALQRVHGVVFNDPECRYQNFRVIPGGAQLSNPGPRPDVVSSCVILPDRIQVREEMTGIARDDFRGRALRVAQVAAVNLGVPVLLARQFVIRSLVNPRHFQDSRSFVASSILKLRADELQLAGREPSLLGVRLAFQASSLEDGMYNVRIESFAGDPRSLFLENMANFRKPIGGGDLEGLGADFDTAYAFLEEQVVPFVARFDRSE